MLVFGMLFEKFLLCICCHRAWQQSIQQRKGQRLWEMYSYFFSEFTQNSEVFFLHLFTELFHKHSLHSSEQRQWVIQ